MKSLANKFFIGLTAVSMSMATAVYAQNMPEHHGQSGMDRSKMVEKMQSRRVERQAKHQVELHTKLKLTEAQEPAWKTFTAATAPGAIPAMPDRQSMAKMTAPERMEKMLDLSKQRQAKMESHLAALKTFYAALTPDQQKIVDASHARMHGKNMRHYAPQRDTNVEKKS
jgi:protein CpxP